MRELKLTGKDFNWRSLNISPAFCTTSWTHSWPFLQRLIALISLVGETICCGGWCVGVCCDELNGGTDDWDIIEGYWPLGGAAIYKLKWSLHTPFIHVKKNKKKHYYQSYEEDNYVVENFNQNWVFQLE